MKSRLKVNRLKVISVSLVVGLLDQVEEAREAVKKQQAERQEEGKRRQEEAARQEEKVKGAAVSKSSDASSKDKGQESRLNKPHKTELTRVSFLELSPKQRKKLNINTIPQVVKKRLP